nr:hypothetical protein CFP56_25753 [Quercus suber]
MYGSKVGPSHFIWRSPAPFDVKLCSTDESLRPVTLVTQRNDNYTKLLGRAEHSSIIHAFRVADPADEL